LLGVRQERRRARDKGRGRKRKKARKQTATRHPIQRLAQFFPLQHIQSTRCVQFQAFIMVISICKLSLSQVINYSSIL
jgi:hypothetical protein